jgi:hypothetical protein
LKKAGVEALAVSGKNLFAALYPGGVFLSTNNGTSWTEVNSGLTNTNVLSLAVSRTDLFAGIYILGVWRRPLSDMTSSVPFSPDELTASPTLDFFIQPNPARDALMVHCDIPGLDAEFNLFNALGERVLNTHADNSAETTIDVSALPSGMYVLSLRNGAEAATRTVMIVR